MSKPLLISINHILGKELGNRDPERRNVLDFGCGPVPIYSAAVASWATTITMCDLLPTNR